MGMFGNRGLTASQQVAQGGDGTSMSAARPHGPDWRRIAGIVGDGLAGLAGQPGMYAQQQYRLHAEQSQQQAELQRQLLLAQYKQQNPDPTGTMQNVQAAGFRPGTPEYQQFMQKALMAPRIMAVPGEGGTTDYRDFNQPQDTPAAGPQPGAVQDGYVFMGGDPANEASWRKQ